MSTHRTGRPALRLELLEDRSLLAANGLAAVVGPSPIPDPPAAISGQLDPDEASYSRACAAVPYT
jgi:hypothetical protein